MSFLNERSVILDNWMIVLPTFLLVLSYFYLKGNRKEAKNAAQMPISQDEKIKSLAESEYIGEYHEEDGIADDNKYMPFLKDEEHIPFRGVKITMQGGIERFYEMVNDRRSVRKYSSRKVDFEVIKKCIQAAGTSPSGAHTQPWTFCVVQNPSIKQKIRDIIEAEELQNYTQRMSRKWTIDLRPLKTNHVKEYLTDAPYLILIFKKVYGVRTDGQKQQHYYNEVSISIATGILLCAIQSAGLNSLISTPLNSGPALRQLLNRPSNEKLLVLLPVGYAADDCKVPNLKRKPIDEILVTF